MNTLLEDVEIKGSLSFKTDLVLQGKIEGEINTPGSLTVGDKAAVQGDIKTRSVTLFGKVDGTINASERCDMKATANVNGDITAATLSMEEGATFVGTSKIGKSAGAAK